VAEMRMQNMQMQRWCCHQCPIAQALHPPHWRAPVRPQM
jgi:hypothetical protein